MPGDAEIPGAPNFLVESYLKIEESWREEFVKAAQGKGGLSLARSNEYCSYIIEAILTDRPFVFNGNLPNTGLISNLPPDCCVEVPTTAKRNGFYPSHIGSLPPQLAALNQMQVAVQEMTVEAAITGNREMVYHACLYDPYTAAVCSMDEIRKMSDELFEAQEQFLPQFKK